MSGQGHVTQANSEEMFAGPPRRPSQPSLTWIKRSRPGCPSSVARSPCAPGGHAEGPPLRQHKACTPGTCFSEATRHGATMDPSPHPPPRTREESERTLGRSPEFGQLREHPQRHRLMKGAPPVQARHVLPLLLLPVLLRLQLQLPHQVLGLDFPAPQGDDLRGGHCTLARRWGSQREASES